MKFGLFVVSLTLLNNTGECQVRGEPHHDRWLEPSVNECEMCYEQCTSQSNRGGGGLSGIKCLDQFPNCAKCEGGFDACLECLEGYEMRDDGSCGLVITFEDAPFNEQDYMHTQPINLLNHVYYDAGEGIFFQQYWYVLNKELYPEDGRWNMAKSHDGSGVMVGAVHNGGIIAAPINEDGVPRTFTLKSFRVLSSLEPGADPLSVRLQISRYQRPHTSFTFEIAPGELITFGSPAHPLVADESPYAGRTFDYIQSIYFIFYPGNLLFIDDIVVD